MILRATDQSVRTPDGDIAILWEDEAGRLVWARKIAKGEGFDWPKDLVFRAASWVRGETVPDLVIRVEDVEPSRVLMLEGWEPAQDVEPREVRAFDALTAMEVVT